jgi:hypothetical protein
MDFITFIDYLVNFIGSKEELPDKRKESVNVPMYKESNATYCINCCEISLISNSYKILSNILPRLSQHIDKITGDPYCGF